MCFVPIDGGDHEGTHRLIHPSLIHRVTVTKDNLDEIASALGIKGKDKAKLKPGTLHIIHEPTSKSRQKSANKKKR